LDSAGEVGLGAASNGGVLVLSRYVELGLALKLLSDSAEGVGYLLKDRVGIPPPPAANRGGCLRRCSTCARSAKTLENRPPGSPVSRLPREPQPEQRCAQSDSERKERAMKTPVIQREPEQPVPRGETAERSRRGSVRQAIGRHPLISFFLLAFAITWAPTPFGSFMAGGPLLAAIIVTAAVDGRPGLRVLWRRIVNWRVGWRWYVVALLVPLAVGLGSGGLNVALGAPGSAFGQLQISSIVLLFALRLVVPVLAPVGEEPGWRGFALPRLLDGRSALAATAVLAPIVALWHVPLIFIEGEDLAPILLLATVAVTFWYSWLFLRTGSVYITIVAHAAEGLLGRTLTGTDGWSGSNETHWNLLYTAGWCVVALAVVALDWQLWRSRVAVPDVSGETADRIGASPAPAR
jgi:uncharacterized protein